MVAKLNRFLGSGLYSVAEAALYAKVSTGMMHRWVFGNASGKSVIDPQFGQDDQIVSFLDFVQTLAIREIQIQAAPRKIPLQRFRKAIKIAESHGLKYPFARKHCTFLQVVENELVIKPPGDKYYFEASGKHRGQRLISFVEMYLKDLTFDSDGLASRYQIYKGENEVPIVMNPQCRFGEPLLPSGYSAKVIWESIRSEGSIDRTVEVYGISRDEVETAYKFFVNHLGRSVA